MKKITLTSVIAMCAIAPAMATPTNTSSTFPNDELMQADYTYTNQATYPNTGVYDGDVTANAQYDWDLFSPTAGNYLPANSTTITQCPAGSFCGGATNIHYDSVAQGITACSTLGDNSYTQSAAGSDEETDCYKECTVANANISHATTVTGEDHYGAGTDTCAATACESGWHVTSGACVANTINITWNGATAAAISANEAGTCTYGGDIRTPQTYDATAVPTGKHFVGWKFVKTQSAPACDLSVLDSTADLISFRWKPIRESGSAMDPGEDIGLSAGEFEQTYSFGTVKGLAVCSSVDDGGPDVDVNNTDPYTGTINQSGESFECWCRITEFNNGTNTCPVTTLPWVDQGLWSDYENHCLDNCAEYCSNLNPTERMRQYFFGEIANIHDVYHY